MYSRIRAWTDVGQCRQLDLLNRNFKLSNAPSFKSLILDKVQETSALNRELSGFRTYLTMSSGGSSEALITNDLESASVTLEYCGDTTDGPTV